MSAQPFHGTTSVPDGTPDGVWTRDDIGEYHDGRGNLIGRDRDGWWVAPSARNYKPLSVRYRTLKAAQQHFREATDGNA